MAGFPSTGIYAYEAEDFTVSRVRARDNQGYGIAGFELSGLRYLDSVAMENDAPGIYVGDSPEAQAVIRGNTANSNGVGGEGFGFLIRDSSHGRGDRQPRVGQLRRFPLPRPSLRRPGRDAERLDGGRQHRDPQQRRLPGRADLLPGLLGRRDAALRGERRPRDEEPRRRQPAVRAVGATQGASCVASSLFLGGAESTDNVVSRNVALLNRPDIGWDGKGTGNGFEHNLCASSMPSGICTARAARPGPSEPLRVRWPGSS